MVVVTLTRKPYIQLLLLSVQNITKEEDLDVDTTVYPSILHYMYGEFFRKLGCLDSRTRIANERSLKQLSLKFDSELKFYRNKFIYDSVNRWMMMTTTATSSSSHFFQTSTQQFSEFDNTLLSIARNFKVVDKAFLSKVVNYFLYSIILFKSLSLEDLKENNILIQLNLLEQQQQNNISAFSKMLTSNKELIDSLIKTLNSVLILYSLKYSVNYVQLYYTVLKTYRQVFLTHERRRQVLIFIEEVLKQNNSLGLAPEDVAREVNCQYAHISRSSEKYNYLASSLYSQDDDDYITYLDERIEQARELLQQDKVVTVSAATTTTVDKSDTLYFYVYSQWFNHLKSIFPFLVYEGGIALSKVQSEDEIVSFERNLVKQAKEHFLKKGLIAAYLDRDKKLIQDRIHLLVATC